MSSKPPHKQTHHVLQLHGGGTLVLCEIIKCAVLERATGRRINDLFQTTIADSGGAIARLCLEKLTAEELLKTFIGIVENTFPGKRFYYTQPLSREPKRFDNSELQNQVKSILQGCTLGDLKGNLFVGAHQHGEGAVKFEKITTADGITHYNNASSTTPLSSIAQMTSTIPGVYNESMLDNPEHADGTYLDSIVNQNPAPLLSEIKINAPQKNIYFLQVGNIEDKDIVESLLKRSVMTSRLLNLHWKYIVHQLHSSHLADVIRVIGKDKADALITYGNGRFSPSDPSIDQLTRVTIETFADIERRQDDYQNICQRLNDNQPLCMNIAQAIAELKIVLDPLMKKRKVILGKNEPIPQEFPSPEVVWAERSKFYKPAYTLGTLTQAFAPHLCQYLIQSDFKFGAAFRLACQSGLKKLIPSPHREIEPK